MDGKGAVLVDKLIFIERLWLQPGSTKRCSSRPIPRLGRRVSHRRTAGRFTTMCDRTRPSAIGLTAQNIRGRADLPYVDNARALTTSTQAQQQRKDSIDNQEHLLCIASLPPVHG